VYVIIAKSFDTTDCNFSIKPFSNKHLNLATLGAILLMAFVLFTPYVNTAFGFVYLEPIEYLMAIGFAIVPIIVMEIFKALKIIKA
jgi:Ca2+-transporting ATPase